jgi:hypothetical protein
VLAAAGNAVFACLAIRVRHDEKPALPDAVQQLAERLTQKGPNIG